ncbi:nodulin MtN3 family protein [Artemisia annua]|uniref:Bidirectional sugar transporter SWEET n=1 Tax=Artemisia annua TaxID=35608 RepID=A0A2U1L2R4_ARTAN|nr:nodulin MtN3 family protein [Artemisia annua]
MKGRRKNGHLAIIISSRKLKCIKAKLRCIKSKTISTITSSYEINHEITGKVYQRPLSKAHHHKRSTKPENRRIEELNISIRNIISVLMFLSPAKTFWRIVNKGSTEEFESLPYICTLLNSSLWTYYGITRPDSYLVATVNGFGVLVEIVYISLFLIYAPPRTKAKTAIVAGIVDVAVFAAAVLRLVVTTKSVEYMPFLLSLFMFLNGGVWTFYAFLVKDWFLGVPNGTGFILGFAQIALYLIYRNSKPTKLVSDNLDDGWQHRHLLPSSTPNHTDSV